MLDILVASSSIFRQFSERKEIRSLNTRNREMAAFQAYWYYWHCANFKSLFRFYSLPEREQYLYRANNPFYLCFSY